MYLEHFGLREAPFSLTPDTSYFLNRCGYQDALNVLLLALRSGEGFVKVTGEVGTGKTLLCRKLINTLGDRFAVAYLHNPFLDPRGLLFAVAEELGVTLAADTGSHALQKALAGRLVELHRDGVRVVVCLDEVQAMPADTLEALRLLTNLETEKRKLLQVVLFGQPELDELLAMPSVRQLRQRITFSYNLLPLSRPALDAYVGHRLAVAGDRLDPLFSRPALDRIQRATGGVPRLVNIVCHKTLMVAFGRGLAQADAACAAIAIEDSHQPGLRQGAGGWRALWGLLERAPGRHWSWAR